MTISILSATPSNAMHASGKKPDDKSKKPDDKKGPVRTMMVGEDGGDIGYDPDSIPTEDIPDDDD